jgi:hypothetical protein
MAPALEAPGTSFGATSTIPLQDRVDSFRVAHDPDGAGSSDCAVACAPLCREGFHVERVPPEAAQGG